ncbi:unnamed protein product [Rotaria sordida]|uniref:DUF4817 domain-containing protein n=1 Tax=Rotaria sordida TaxID=392033 RepID=A0A819WWK9_9BILA|nr:unnamed protein product [Rotaria sordida]CAF4130626.1 unnamed protein product [Rotaria sordida]
MARRQLSVNEKTWIVKHMYRVEYSINVQRLWCKEINKNPPHRDTIRVLMKKFEQTGSVLDISPPASHLASSSNILWILDGCDERTIPDHLLAIEQQLLDKQYVLLTSRPYGTDKCHYNIKVHIQGFTKDNIKTYIDKYFSIINRIETEKLWSFIDYPNQMILVASIPVCLQMICIIWERRKDDLEIGMTMGHLLRKSFLATQSYRFAISGHQISIVTGALFLSSLQVSLLNQRSRYSYSVLVEKNNSKEQKDVEKFITEQKYNRRMRDTFMYFFDLKRSSSCMELFWSAVDCEPRDLIGLRHCSRIMN